MNKETTKMTYQLPADPAAAAAPPPVAMTNIEPKETDHPHDHIQLSSHEEEEQEQEQEGGAAAVEDNIINMRSAPAAVVEVGSCLLADEDINGRERLKRHRTEVAGQVWIPDIWGQEEMLKDWIDCSAFDASLVPTAILSARAALAQEGRRANSGAFRIENRC